MLRIRLSRTGKKRQPSYRVVVAEKEAKRDGRVVERIGYYNPLTNPADYKIDEARALHWLSVGAQPSDAVRVLLDRQGTLGRLARYHAGDSMDMLVSEFTGVAPVAADTKVTKSVVVEAEKPALVEKVTEAVSGVVSAVAEPVAAVAEKVEDVAEAGIEKIEEVIEGLLDADEEE